MSTSNVKDITEIFARMKSGEISVHSELGTRDETKQTKSYAARFRKLKIAVGLKARILVMKDVVVPFNPFTGVQDDSYNEKTPFRPILLVSQVLAGIKQACAGDSVMAETWERILGIEPGVIKWEEPPTLNDYYHFKARGYIKPRVMSYPTVSLNFGGSGGFSDYRTKYTVDPAGLDENNNYSYDNAPIWHKGAIFFNSMAAQEAAEAEATLKKQAVSKETIAAKRREIFSRSPIGFVSPTNLIPFLYFSLDERPKEMSLDSHSDFEGCIRWMNKTNDKWDAPLEEAMKDNTYDENMDFFDFTLKTPSSSQTKSNGQVYTDEDYLDLYKAMTITSADARVSAWTGKTMVDGVSYQNSELYKSVWAAAANYFLFSQEQSSKEDGETFEKLMASSNNFRPITSILDRLLPACQQVFLSTYANSKYFTEDVKRANSEFFMAMSPDNVMALADADDEDLEVASREQAASISSLISNVREAVGIADMDLDALDISE